MQIDNNGLIVTGKKAIQLKPYIVRSPKKFELMTDDEIVNGAGGTLIVDTESYKNYFLIAFKDIKTKKIIILESDIDKDIYFNKRQLSWIMHSYRTIGFNTIKYDLPLIWLAYTNQAPSLLKEASNRIINENLFPQEFAKDYNIKIHRTSHVDLIEVCPLRGSLKLYGARLHAPRIQELPFNPNRELTSEEINITRDYCINDLDITELLFNNLTEQIKLRTELSIEYRQDLLSKSDAQIAEAVISSELYKLTGKWPKKPKIEDEKSFHFIAPQNMFFQTNTMNDVLATILQATFELDMNGRLIKPKQINDLKIRIGKGIYRIGIGGLHSSEENIANKADADNYIYDRDVASFYPRIVLNCRLYPQHLGEPFLLVYNGLVVRRLSAKEAKRIAESENLKVTINGTFGKTGSPYSILYAPEMTIQITVGGQLYLLMLIERLELADIPVVSANTDGILIKCPKDKKAEYLAIIKMWEQITGFETEETEYEAVYSRDVNAYLAVKKDGKVKGKNAYYDPWRSTNPKDLYWRFQKNPNAQICIEAVEKLIIEKIPVEKTIKSCTDICKFLIVMNVVGGAHKNGNYLGKVVRWYFAKNEKGNINRISNGNKVPDSDGGCPCMDLPDTLPLDIDYEKYINKAIKMLYNMAYLEKPRQISFF